MTVQKKYPVTSGPPSGGVGVCVGGEHEENS